MPANHPSPPRSLFPGNRRVRLSVRRIDPETHAVRQGFHRLNGGSIEIETTKLPTWIYIYVIVLMCLVEKEHYIVKKKNIYIYYT